jgi:hypothetical protein
LVVWPCFCACCTQLSEADVDKRGDGYVLKADPAVRVQVRNGVGVGVGMGAQHPPILHGGSCIPGGAHVCQVGWQPLAITPRTHDASCWRRARVLDIACGRMRPFLAHPDPRPRAPPAPAAPQARAHKMSKSRGNVINPDDVVNQFGADSLRLYELFMGPLRDTKVGSTGLGLGLGLLGLGLLLRRRRQPPSPPLQRLLGRAKCTVCNEAPCPPSPFLRLLGVGTVLRNPHARMHVSACRAPCAGAHNACAPPPCRPCRRAHVRMLSRCGARAA